jgi:hypothetical protein
MSPEFLDTPDFFFRGFFRGRPSGELKIPPLNYLVVSSDRLPENAYLAVLLDRVACCGLHQHMLSLRSDMLLKVSDMIQRTGQEILQLRESHLVYCAVSCFGLVQDGPSGDRFEAVRGGADRTFEGGSQAPDEGCLESCLRRVPNLVTFIRILGDRDVRIGHANRDRDMNRWNRARGNGQRATGGSGAVHGQVVPLLIREDGGEYARGFHECCLAQGAVFSSNLPKEVMKLRFVFQGCADVVKGVRGSHCSAIE